MFIINFHKHTHTHAHTHITLFLARLKYYYTLHKLDSVLKERKIIYI